MPTQICSVMTQDVIQLDPNMTLTELDRTLVAAEVSGGPVVEDGIVVGVVSRADVIRALYEEQKAAANVSGFYSSPYPMPIPALEHLARDSRRIADHMTTMRVDEIMSREVQSVGPSDDVVAVARMMAAKGYHRVPVLEGDALVGIVTTLDLVRVMGAVGLAE
jgi:CBS domain-containing protein